MRRSLARLLSDIGRAEGAVGDGYSEVWLAYCSTEVAPTKTTAQSRAARDALAHHLTLGRAMRRSMGSDEVFPRLGPGRYG